jgi:tetratricopeptide (TPR) repeat protein
VKIFVSYGQDRNAPLVERVARDLEAGGHEVWIDKSKIKAGDDWRRSILDGLVDTDWTLGFLSKHSTRDPGVCLDELAIALHVKGGTIATVLMESEAEVAPPVSVSRIQWLDMHDWAERQAEGGAEWETWYRERLNEILALLADPATQRFAGEIKDLERRLKPVMQEADVGVLVEGFVGRAWLQEKVEEWRRNAKDSRLLWLMGSAGTGKSAFAAWLTHRGKVNVIGLNLCRYNLDDRRDAGRVIRTLAFQIATRLPDYRRLVLERLVSQDPDGSELARKGPAAAFNWLLIEPLRRAIDGGRSSHRYLIVIDGLDETVRDGRSELAEILCEHVGKLPSWIAMVVTSRPDEPIQRQFAGLQPVTIKAESTENLDDLRAYTSDWLAHFDLPDAELAALTGRAVAASEGNFLYLRMLREAVAAGTLNLLAPEGLPQGLVGLYERWFRRQFPDASTYESYVPLLAVLAAAEHPVPEPWLARIFGWSKRDAARKLAGLGSLFERRPDGVAPFHKSLRDWLVDARASGAEFVVDEEEGARRLVNVLWAELARLAEEAKNGEAASGEPRRAELDPFCVAELPTQLARLPAQDMRKLIAEIGGWVSLRPILFEVAESLAARFAWEEAMAWWAMARSLATMEGEAGRADQARALVEAGDISATVGRSAAALASFRDGLALAQAAAASDPASGASRHILSVLHAKIGDVLVAQGDLAEALASFREGRDTAELLTKSDPGNADWQRDLSVLHDRVGDVLVAQGHLAEALACFRDGLAIATRLAAAAPDNVGWRRDLSVSHDKIGNVLVAQGNLAEAETCFRDGLAIAERLSSSNPENARWQRDLSVFHDRIGDVLTAQGDLAGAERCFRDGLAIAKRLAQSDPGNAGWQRDLAVSHDKVGDVMAAQEHFAEAETSFREGLAIRERLARSDPGNAGWQSHLAASHSRIGAVLMTLGNLPEAEKSFLDGLGIAERLAKSDLENAQWQRDLSVFHDRIGEVLAAQDNLSAALTSFRGGLAIADRLAKSDPGNAQWQRDLSVYHDQIADILVAQGELPEALTNLRAGLEIARLLVTSDRDSPQWLHDLSVSCDKVGDVLVVQGDFAGALASFREGLAAAERLAKSDPGNAQWQRDVSVSHNRIGDVLVAQGNPEEALASFRAGLGVRERLAQADPGNLGRQIDLSLSLDRVGDVLLAGGDLPAALTSFRSGLELRERLAKADPANARWRRELSASYAKIAIVFEKAGETALAEAASSQSRAIIEAMGEDARADVLYEAEIAAFGKEAPDC